MSAMVHPLSGLDMLDTPALVVDLDRLETNIDRWAAFARQAGVRLRPREDPQVPRDRAPADIPTVRSTASGRSTGACSSRTRHGVSGWAISSRSSPARGGERSKPRGASRHGRRYNSEISLTRAQRQAGFSAELLIAAPKAMLATSFHVHIPTTRS